MPVPGHTPATVIPDWWATRRDHPAPDHTSPTVPMPSPNRAGDPERQHLFRRAHETAIAAADGRRVVRAAVVVWLPGLAVALGAAVATAHGLYEVALAARVPAGIAWLYPLITDGLALVAYAATTRLRGPAARYAWSVVVLAAGLSGLAQATLSAPRPRWMHRRCCGTGSAPGPRSPPPSSRTCSTSWPPTPQTPPSQAGVQSAPFRPAGVQPAATTVQPAPVQPSRAEPVQPASPTGVQPARPRPLLTTMSGDRAVRRSGPSPARDRAQAAAARHANRHGRLPTVSELAVVADVSRGTAATALNALREQPAASHLITDTPDQGAPHDPH